MVTNASYSKVGHFKRFEHWLFELRRTYQNNKEPQKNGKNVFLLFKISAYNKQYAFDDKGFTVKVMSFQVKQQNGSQVF